MKRVSPALLLAAIMLLAARADAQPAPWAPERVTAGWTMLPAITFGGMWDSNVTVQNPGGSGAAATVQEWVGVVNPRGELVYNGRATRFNGGYSGRFERYRELSQLDRYEQRARATLRHRVNRNMELSGMAAMLRAPSTDRLELDAVPFLRIGSRTLDAAATMNYSFTSRTSLETTYRFQQVAFDPNQGALIPAFLRGGHYHAPSVAVRQAMTSRLSAGAIYEFQHAIVAGGLNRFNVQSALGEVNFQISSRTKVSGSAGAAHLDAIDRRLATWGPSFRGTFDTQMSRALFNAHYERSFVPAFSFGGVTASQRVSSSVTVPLTRAGRLTAFGSVAYSRTEPLRTLGVGLRLNSYWVNGTLGYQISRWLRSEAFVTTNFQRRDPFDNIDRTRIGFQLSTSKPMRIQ